MNLIAFAAVAVLAGSDLTQADYTQVIDRVSPYELVDAWRDATGDRIEPGTFTATSFTVRMRRSAESYGEFVETDCSGNGSRIRCQNLQFNWTVRAPRKAGARASDYYLGTNSYTTRAVSGRSVQISRQEDFHGGTTRGHAFHLVKLVAEDMKRTEAAVAEHGTQATFELTGPPAEADAY